MDDIEARLRRLEDLREIEQLKYRYWRYLDLKLWDEMGSLFVADATVNYGSGRYEFRGRDAILKFLVDSLGAATGAMTIHHGHHPEIELTGPDTAKGTWALYNYLYNVRQNRAVRIGAYYHDEYVKQNGVWRFAHIGYENIFHEEWKRNDIASLKLLIG